MGPEPLPRSLTQEGKKGSHPPGPSALLRWILIAILNRWWWCGKEVCIYRAHRAQNLCPIDLQPPPTRQDTRVLDTSLDPWEWGGPITSHTRGSAAWCSSGLQDTCRGLALGQRDDTGRCAFWSACFPFPSA